MTVKINFSKIQKCDQIWDDMPVCDSGRLCQQCDRVIHDFRGMTDWDIAVKHANSSSKVCGIYDEHTLSGRSKSRTVPLKKGRKALWAATMAGLTSITTINAQAHSDKSESVHIVEKDREAKDHVLDQNRVSAQDSLATYKQRILKGKIVDKEMQEGIVAATVIIAGTEIGTISDTDGYFTLDLSQEISEQDSVKLIVSYLGFAKSEIVIHSDRFNLEETIVLEEDVMMIADVSLVSFGVIRPPWYKRVWNKIKNVFR